MLTCDWLEDDGRELNELQRVRLFETALRCFDGVEAAVRHELERNVEPELRFRAVS